MQEPPAAQTLPAGTNARFTVVAVGQPLYYQWKFAGTPLNGATGASLNLTNLQSVPPDDYSVVTSSHLGAVETPPALLTVAAADSAVVFRTGAGTSHFKPRPM